MAVYEIAVRATHEVFERATKFMQEIGYDDVKGLLAEIIVGHMTFERALTEEEVEEVRKVLLEQRDKFEKLVGMKVLDIKLKRVE